MATAKQKAANKRNAARSTGPRTQEGKARSKMNALRHGLAAIQSDTGLTWEDSTFPSFGDIRERIDQIERARLKLLHEINRLNTVKSSAPRTRALERLAALERYIQRAHSKLKQMST